MSVISRLRRTLVPPVRVAPMGAERDDRDIAEIRSSGLFDADFYLARYPDVAASGMDPAAHYLATGASEGRDAGEGFDWRWYLGECPEAGLAGSNPLLHYLRFGRQAGFSPKAIDAGQAFDSFSAATRAGDLPFAAAYRTAVERVDFPLGRAAPLAPDGLPAPPLTLLSRIGSTDLDNMAAIGRGARDTILRCLPADFDFAGKRCLDYGCGIGRVIRYFADQAKTCEFWGCDIDGPSVRWLTEQLSPPFRFYRIGGAPSLPFEDDSLDLIYAVGVFSQIYDGWQHLAAEIRRVLRPGGLFLMTITGQNPFEDHLRMPFSTNEGMLLWHPFSPWSLGGPLVFVTPEWIARHWGTVFDIDAIVPNGMLDYDTLVLMRKPTLGAPFRGGARIVETGTRQAFSPDSFGLIQQSFDPSERFLDSYGVEVAPGVAEVRGSIVMRGGPDRIEASLGGRPLALDVAWSEPTPHPRRLGLTERSFVLRFDTDGIGPERTRLDAVAHGPAGLTHALSIPFRVVAARTGAADGRAGGG